ncbi:MAG: methyltransferase family protein [Gammaproteobacteria bacterium]
MTPVQSFWLVLGLIWFSAEFLIAVLTRLQRNSSVVREHRSELYIWLVVCLSLTAALALKEEKIAQIPLPYSARQITGGLFFFSGLGLRLYAVSCLGRFFSTRVSIQRGHVLVVGGPYRYLRHPSYSGLMIGFLGAGIAMGDFLSVLALLAPLFWVLTRRMAVEERWLLNRFGSDYERYCMKTRKLIPGLY